MNLKKLYPTTLILALFTLFFIFRPAIQALPPQNVELISFGLISLNNAIRIEWETATELETAGYKIMRGDLPVNYQDLPDIGIVPAEGSPALGAKYAVVDETAVNGNTYFYQLIEIEENLNEKEIASGSVVPGIQPTPTPTGIAIGGGTPANTPLPGQPTNAPTATATQPATAAPNATASPTATPNGRATATRTPTASATPTATATNTPGIAAAQPTHTPTPVPSPTNYFDNSGNTVFAQGDDEQTGYPGPEPTAPSADTAYPGGAAPTIAPPADAPPTPYPAAANTPANTNLPVIGSQGADGGSGEPTGNIAGDGSESGGLGLLWIGFIIAFLVFAAGVVGSIYFFARKREP